MATRTAAFQLVSLALVAGCAGAAPASSRALAVTTGRGHTCALLDDHRAKCWGLNAEGELGLGDTRRRGASAGEMGDALPAVDVGAGRTVAAISAGRSQTCAILDDGSVRCWGMRGFCGVEPDPTNANVGDEPNDMGDALAPLDLGPGRTAKLLAAGYLLSCAVLDDGTARCWGEQPKSDVTRPLVVMLASSRPVVALVPGYTGVLALFDDGTAQDLVEGSEQPPIVPAGAVAVSLAGSARARCAVLSDGTVYCGEADPLTNAFAALHASGKRLVAAGVGELQGACGLDDGGGVSCFDQVQDCTPDWCEASDAAGWVGVRLGRPALALTTAGAGTSCALLTGGSVRCWGQPHGPPNPALGASFDLDVVAGDVRSTRAFRDLDLGSP